jgi:hypothetical protein
MEDLSNACENANLQFDMDNFCGPALVNYAIALWRWPAKTARQLGR